MAKAPKAAAPSPSASRANMMEIGVTGLQATKSGHVFEEFDWELKGARGLMVYRRMADTDPTISGALHAISLILRAVKWTAEPAKDSGEQGKDDAEFAQSLLDDMSHTFEDLIAEILSMLVYGWAYLEVVTKRRVGPNETDPKMRSKYDDGRIGVRKIAIRGQETLQNWIMDEDGGISGMVQNDYWAGTGSITLPIERCLLFRTTSRKNSPEGVSVLRAAYRPWYYYCRIQEVEAIGIERDLAGLPVVRIPVDMLRAAATDPDVATSVAGYQKLARDLRFNEQGGVVLPSDTYVGPLGEVSTVRKVDFELVSSAGSRAINTKEVKTDYQRDMVRSVLADFLMLGTDKGAFNLSESKTNLFLKACETWIDGVQAVFNRYLIPRIWRLNGFSTPTPTYKRGRLTPIDLEPLINFLKGMAEAGATIFPDEVLEQFLREEADLPAKSPEAIKEQEDAAEKDVAAQERIRSATRPAMPGVDEGGAEDAEDEA